MNEFLVRDLKVGDRIARKCWKIAGRVEKVEKGIGQCSAGDLDLVAVKAVIMFAGSEMELEEQDLIAGDWERIPEGHENAGRSLDNSELCNWLRTGEAPQDWSPPSNPPKSLAEICAERIEELQEGVNHWYMTLTYEQLAQKELGYDWNAIYEQAKQIRQRIQSKSQDSD